MQHLEGGIIGAILVKDDDKVVAGQPLIRLDDTKARTTLAALQGQLWDAQASEARLIAERDSAPEPVYPRIADGAGETTRRSRWCSPARTRSSRRGARCRNRRPS